MVFYKTTNDGLYTLQNLSYKEENNSNTNANAIDFRFIHVSHFDCAYSHASTAYEQQNIHEEKRIKFKSRGVAAAAQEEEQRAMHQQQVLAEHDQQRRIRIQMQQLQQQRQQQQQQQQQQQPQRVVRRVRRGFF